MKKSIALLAGCAALAMTPAAHAQDRAPRTFTQSGNWVLDAGEDSCQLASTFTDGEDEIAFALERNRAENLARLILVGDALRTFRNANQLGYRYLPSGDERMAPYVRSQTPDGEPYFNLGLIALGPGVAGFGGPAAGGPPGGGPGAGAPSADGEAFVLPPYDRAAELEFAAEVEGIAVEEGLLRPIRIETGNMRAPIEALQACTDDLLQYWGLDYEAHQTMTRRAAPDGPAYEWIPRNTIGFEDFAKFGGARNPVRVMVSAEGEPTGCFVHWASLDERTNQRICEGIMENGEFTPALDAEGEPIASYWMVDPAFGLSRPFGQ